MDDELEFGELMGDHISFKSDNQDVSVTTSDLEQCTCYILRPSDIRDLIDFLVEHDSKNVR